jgi:hypothetical protein
MAFVRSDLRLENLDFVYQDGAITDVRAAVSFNIIDDTDGSTVAGLVKRLVPIGTRLTTTERSQLRSIVSKIKSELGIS